MDRSFPTSRALLEQRGSPAQASLAHESFSAVDYHLRLCRDAVAGSNRGIAEFSVGIDANSQTSYYVYGLNDPLSLVQWGDVAVQAAASVIEVAWNAINQVLELGIPTTVPLRWWTKANEPGPFQQAIQKLGGDEGRELTRAIERTFGSAGHRLLTGYRNWVIHRGAPVQEPSLNVIGPIPMPGDVHAETDPQKKQWLLRTAARLHLVNAYTVTCWPIVPPVHMRYSLQVENAEQDMEFPGVRIGKGSSVEIKDMKIGVGSLWDPLDEFNKRNLLRVHSAKRTVINEDLAVYSAGDYRMALVSIERFAEEAVTTVLDRTLCRVLQQRFPAEAPGSA